MKPQTTLLLGDCRDSMRAMAADSIDAIVSDPPYGLSFMGRGWDHGVPGEEFWKEALRVAKPGAFLLAFGGTRTAHRLTTAIEDAGWEIRDDFKFLHNSAHEEAALFNSLNADQQQAYLNLHYPQDLLLWTYGSGFPKSHNVALGIDKHLGGANRGRAIPVASRFQASDGEEANKLTSNPVEAYRAKSEEAKRWEGWGSALKPAYEPIVVARKPLVGTIAENVLRYGVGGLNIDGCRVATVDTVKIHSRSSEAADSSAIFIDKRPLETHQTEGQKLGRWPANLIHDGSEEVVRLFPSADSHGGGVLTKGKSKNCYGDFQPYAFERIADKGSAARFFYCSKADNHDRNDGCENLPPRRHSDRPSDDLPGGDNPRNRTNNERSNFHPCVKPTDLMRYLCRLVTPPGGLVLDPFMGSGSTGKAAVLEGFNFVGCELDPDYLEIARARIAFAGGEEPEKPVVASEVQKQMSLTDLWGRK